MSDLIDPGWSTFIRVSDACRAYHRHMTAAMQGLWFHEANGTIRPPKKSDL